MHEDDRELLRLFSRRGLGGGFRGGEVIAAVKRRFAVNDEHAERIATFVIFAAEALARLCVPKGDDTHSSFDAWTDVDAVLIALGIAVSDECGLAFSDEPMVSLRTCGEAFGAIAMREPCEQVVLRADLEHVALEAAADVGRRLPSAVSHFAGSVIGLYRTLVNERELPEILKWLFRAYCDLHIARGILVEVHLHQDLSRARKLNELARE